MANFSIEQATFLLNGHVFSGWSDDADALNIPDIELLTEKRGADGLMVVSSTGEKGGPVVIKLLANSKSVKFLQNFVTAQLVGASIKWTGYYRDPVNNISIAFIDGYLKTAPLGPKQGKGDISNFEYTFVFTRIIPNYTGATT